MALSALERQRGVQLMAELDRLLGDVVFLRECEGSRERQR
jgi:hypothetical protein